MTNNELYHHGIKGQKWGVRRYQNADGSLTAAGKKRYDSMSPDKLQKTLYKQVKNARSEQSESSRYTIWDSRNTIGKNSKAAQDRFNADWEAHWNSDAGKEAIKKWDALDRRLDAGKIDFDEYDAEFEKIGKSVYKAELNLYTSNGRKYANEYMDKYGKDLNIGYLKDLGYDDKTAKDFAERILKANKKMLNGM